MALSDHRAGIGKAVLSPLQSAWSRAQDAAGWLRPPLRRGQAVLAHGWRLFTQTWFARAMIRSIRRRIILSNLIGLSILVIGWTFLSQHNTWLIDAKRAALETQSKIVAAAIASSATLDTPNGSGATESYDPDRMIDRITRGMVLKSDLLDSLDFSLRPEVIAPVLAKLIEGTQMRARVFSTDGTTIVDSNDFIRSDGLLDPTRPQGENKYTKPKNFRTRFLKWRLASDLPVYQDIDGINGRSYPEVRRSLEDARTYSMLLMTEPGEQVVAISAPVMRAGKPHGVLMLSTDPGEIDDILSDERLRIITLVLLALAATFAVSAMLARTVAGPIRKLSDAAEDVIVDINAIAGLPSSEGREDEIGQLGRSFKKMTMSLRSRIKSSERFAADVAHELKNPLTAARATAETLSLAKTDAQREHLVGQIKGELERLSRLITDVSEAQRTEAAMALEEMHPVPMDEVGRNVVDVFRDILAHDNRNVTVVFESSVPPHRAIVRGHDGRIGQVLNNLIDNAISFSPPGGTVTVGLSEDDGQLVLTVDDEGPGVDPNQIEKIFARFYTYRPTSESSRGNNSGLGLSICREIVQAHGGLIWAENRPEGGARFRVEFRTAPSAPERRWSARGRTTRRD